MHMHANRSVSHVHPFLMKYWTRQYRQALTFATCWLCETIANYSRHFYGSSFEFSTTIPLQEYNVRALEWALQNGDEGVHAVLTSSLEKAGALDRAQQLASKHHLKNLRNALK